MHSTQICSSVFLQQRQFPHPTNNPDGLLLCVLSCFSHVLLWVILLTVARQAPLSMGFSRQENWSGLPFPSPGDLPNPGIKPSSLALQVDSLSLNHLGQVVPSCTDLVSSFYQFCFCPMDANCGKCFVIIFVIINIQ